MAFTKIEEVLKLNDQELSDAILEAKRKLFQLRLEKATGRLTKPHQFKETNHWIAQLLTVETQRKMAANPEAKTTIQSRKRRKK